MRPRNTRRDISGQQSQKLETPEQNMIWTTKDYANIAVNVLTLLSVSAYTLLAWWQVQESHKANTIAFSALNEVNKPLILFQGFGQAIVTGQITNPKLRLTLNFDNLGNTPASEVKDFSCDNLIRDDQQAPKFDCKVTTRDHSAIVMGPKQPDIVVSPEISFQDLDAARTGAKSIYIFGYVTYIESSGLNQDGTRRKRLTEYCQRIVPANDPPFNSITVGEPIPPIAGAACSDFNCIDDGCAYQPILDAIKWLWAQAPRLPSSAVAGWF